MEPNWDNYEVRDLLIEQLKEIRLLRRQKQKSTAADFGMVSNDELCTAFGISRWTTEEYRNSGKLPAILIGRQYFYRKADVLKFIEEEFEKAGFKQTIKTELGIE